MLEIINTLAPFFEDCYREIGVREYSRMIKISAPTASNILKNLEKEGLLKEREERRYLLFRANRESDVLKDLSRVYWKMKTARIADHIKSEIDASAIVLFGSSSKLEAKKDSDVDIAIFSKYKKKINPEKFEKELGKKIELFVFESLSKINSKELKINILNGYIIWGELL